MLETAAHDVRVGAAFDGSEGAIQHCSDLRIWIIPELYLVGSLLIAVEGDLDGVAHRHVRHERFCAGHRRRTALDNGVTDNRHIHVRMVIEDALCLVQAQIHEVLANDRDLGVTVCGATFRLDRVHLGRLIVSEGEGG